MSKHISRLSLIGDKIRYKMKAQGHTLESLAAQVGITTSKAGRIVKGVGTTLDVETYERIAVALGLEWEELLNTKAPLNPNLTGVAVVDELLLSFMACLYKGDSGYKEIVPLTTTDYKLRYLYNNVAQNNQVAHKASEKASAQEASELFTSSIDEHIGITIEEEMRLNKIEAENHGSAHIVPVQAWPLGKRKVVVHARSSFGETKEIDHIAKSVPRRTRYRYVDTIELWSLGAQWGEIYYSKAPVQVEDRIIGILGISTSH